MRHNQKTEKKQLFVSPDTETSERGIREEALNQTHRCSISLSKYRVYIIIIPAFIIIRIIIV